MNWKFIKEGDIIDVIAPGYAVGTEEIEGGRRFLENWNLQPRIPKNLIKPHFLHAHDDEVRFEFLKSALLSEDSNTIWCLRGGYGSNRLLPFLAKMKKPKKEKLVIGISDITSLHNFFIQEWGWKTLHAPLLDRLGRGQVSKKHEKELKDLLFGKTHSIEFKKLKPLNEKAKNLKNKRSRIVGGNLTVLQSSLGTPWQIDAHNAFLFVEDIGERGYRIDRMFEQFKQAGIFKGCHGLILGDFIGGEEPATKKNNFKKVFARWAEDLNIPVYTGFEAGHATIQRPVPMNTRCDLSIVNGKTQLLIQSGGIA